MMPAIFFTLVLSLGWIGWGMFRGGGPTWRCHRCGELCPFWWGSCRRRHGR